MDINILKNPKLIKNLSILAFIFLILAILILFVTPSAVGYELSLYEALPWSFWIFSVSNVVISEIVIILSSVSKKCNYWQYGFLSLLTGYVLLLLLPTLRGYVLYGRGQGDILVHIGLTKDILYMGHINENFYPMFHILSANLNYIGFPLESATNFISAYFSIIFIIFIYILAKSISKNTRKTLFILAFASPLLFSYFHVSVHPSILSVFILPLFLYSFHRCRIGDNGLKFKIIALLIAFLIVFFHPVTNIIIIVILIVFSISSFFQDKINIHKSKKGNVRYLVMLLTVSFFAWALSFYEVTQRIGRIFEGLFYQTESSVTESYVSLLSVANLSILQTIQFFINKYGPIVMYFTISFFSVIYVLNNIRKRKIKYFEISYCLQFLAGIIFSGIFLFGYFIENEPLRVSRYAIIMSIIISALVFYEIFMNSRRKFKRKLITIIIVLVICSTSVLGVLNIYASSRVYKPNNQLTHMEKNGFCWFLEKRNRQISLVKTGFDLGKYEIYYFGFENYKYNWGKSEENVIPSHFGYGENKTLHESFEYRNLYMITSEFNRQAYLVFPKNVRERTHQYLNEDFKKLNNDYTVNKIYENGEFENWII